MTGWSCTCSLLYATANSQVHHAFCINKHMNFGGVVAKRLTVHSPDSSFGVTDQQGVGSSPGHGTCVLEQDTYVIP